MTFVEYQDDIIISRAPLSEEITRTNQNYWNSTKNEYTEEKNKIHQGGGAANKEKQHKKGRLTARERINKLIDPDVPFFELGTFVAYEMYTEWGGCPCGGVITGFGSVSGRQCMIIANDATVKAGSFFPTQRDDYGGASYAR